MEPENTILEKEKHLQSTKFLGSSRSFSGVSSYFISINSLASKRFSASATLPCRAIASNKVVRLKLSTQLNWAVRDHKFDGGTEIHSWQAWKINRILLRLNYILVGCFFR